jgi:hypothetical protein
MNKFLLFLIGSVFLCLPSFGQLDCFLPKPNQGAPDYEFYANKLNAWVGFVWQLPSNYTGALEGPDRDFYNSGTFKGYMPYDRPGFLPSNHYNFDMNFNITGNTNTDSTFFSTIAFADRNTVDNTPGCEVQHQYFGVLLRTKIWIPEPGIYKITIGSDDGSFLRSNNDIIHDNWGPGKTYNYEENIFTYYRSYPGNDYVGFDLSYYELQGSNRLSFKLERYFGPGEIEGSQDVCGIAPDPVAFVSKGPATYAQGNDGGITYQWQYSLDDDPEGAWTDIPEATSLTYKVPKYEESDTLRNWTGMRYFRRVAIPTAVVSEPTASNIVSVNINPIENMDQAAFGDNKWIGHVYRGSGVFTDENYAGRIEESGVDFSQHFGGISMLDHRFDLVNGCYVTTTNFSVKYKMRLTVDNPGTYTFRLTADDGFRFFINDELQMNHWTSPPNVERTMEYYVTEPGYLDLKIEYYEKGDGNLMRFNSKFVILPLEWGRLSAEACGQDNCLTWETIQEKNTSHFELERSYDGVEWEMFDNSVQAQGNSTELHTYHFTDRRVMASKVYYRIRQVDLDEAFAYSDVMRVDNPFYVQSFVPFPNPTTDKIRFFSHQNVVGVSLISHDYLTHRTMDPVRLHDKRYEVDLGGLKAGVYLFIVRKEDGETETFRIIKN